MFYNDSRESSSEKLALFGGTPVSKSPFKMSSPIGFRELCGVNLVLRRGVLSRAGRGQQVKEFEKEFAEFLNVPYAVSTTSGTSALHTAMCALGIGSGDEVIVPALTFISTASVVLQQRAKAVFADIDPSTFCIDASDLSKKITSRTKAIIVVHLYGQPAQMEKILEIARERHVKVVEDCAQAHGATYQGKRVGSIGDIGCFSFYQTKILTCGEGGMVATRDPQIESAVRAVVDHGSIDRERLSYDYDRLGYNYHMTEIQAAIGRAQLKKLSQLIVIRERNAHYYRKGLSDTPISFQDSSPEGGATYYTLTALLPKRMSEKRNWFLEAVQAENVPVNCLYPKSLPETRLFSSNAGSHVCPTASDVASRLINFYVNPGVTRRQIRLTVQAVRKVFSFLDQGYER